MLVLEVLYNTVLATGLLATVISHLAHEHPRVEWSRAWSLVPGRVHVRDLKLRHENPSGTSWQLAMDEVKVDLSLLSLEGVPFRRAGPPRVQIGPGELAYEETTVAHIDQGSGEFYLETLREGPDNGLDLIAGLTGGRFQSTATHPALNELARIASGPTGVSLRGGAGKLEVDSVGVETGAGDTHVQVLHASSWYQKRTGTPTE